jgi:hypothetical protein
MDDCTEIDEYLFDALSNLSFSASVRPREARRGVRTTYRRACFGKHAVRNWLGTLVFTFRGNFETS